MKRRPSPRNVAIGISLVFHAALLLVLLLCYVPMSGDADSPFTGDTFTGDTAPLIGDTARLKSSEDTPRPTPPANLQPTEINPEDLVAAEINGSIEQQIEQTQRLSVDQQQSELEKNLERLESLADGKSVEAVSSTIANTLGLDTDQYDDSKQPVEGPLDTESAQIMDVRKSRLDLGRVQYETRMVDSAGREMWVPLSEAEGEQLYETFETMKKFPMAKGIYQSVVIPVMQKMLDSEFQRPRKPTVILPATNGQSKAKTGS